MFTPEEADTPVSPKVFISYSWTSDEHADWVRDLATRLRGSSMVDVVLDSWDLKPGQDKYKFMEQMSTDPTVQKVLVICDKRYAERADARLGGVGTESTIISQEVYNQVAQEKFIPIVAERDPDGEPFLPVFLKSRIYIDLSDPLRYEAGYEELVLAIGGERTHPKPPLGKASSMVRPGGRPSPPTTHARRAFEDAVLKDKRNAIGFAGDYLDALVETLRALRLEAENLPGKEVLPGVMLERLEAWKPSRDEFVEFLRFTSQHSQDARLFAGLPGFFEKCLALMSGPYSDRANEHINYIAQETLLYAVAVLLRAEGFEAVGALLDEYYRDNRYSEGGRLQRYTVFAHGETRFLEQVAQQTWDRRYHHPLWRLTQLRATNEAVPFEALREADVLLHLRFLLEEKREGPRVLSWFPVTFTYDYVRDYEFECPTFQRATSRRYFARFKTVLGVDSKDELLQRWNAAFPSDAEVTAKMRSERADIIQKLVNLNRMDTT